MLWTEFNCVCPTVQLLLPPVPESGALVPPVETVPPVPLVPPPVPAIPPPVETVPPVAAAPPEPAPLPPVVLPPVSSVFAGVLFELQPTTNGNPASKISPQRHAFDFMVRS